MILIQSIKVKFFRKPSPKRDDNINSRLTLFLGIREVVSIFGKCEILLSFVGKSARVKNDSVVLSRTFDQLCLLYVQMKRSNKLLAIQIDNARDIYNFVKKSFENFESHSARSTFHILGFRHGVNRYARVIFYIEGVAKRHWTGTALQAHGYQTQRQSQWLPWRMPATTQRDLKSLASTVGLILGNNAFFRFRRF